MILFSFYGHSLFQSEKCSRHWYIMDSFFVLMKWKKNEKQKRNGKKRTNSSVEELIHQQQPQQYHHWSGCWTYVTFCPSSVRYPISIGAAVPWDHWYNGNGISTIDGQREHCWSYWTRDKVEYAVFFLHYILL